MIPLKVKVAIIFLSLIFLPVLSAKALTDPGSYTPPVNSEGLYPTPDDPNFPAPGNFMRETLGFTVDEINDTVKYFRSNEWMDSMKNLRRELQTILDQRPVNESAQAAAFPGLYERAQILVTEHRQKLQEKLQYNLEKPWLNDKICENIDNVCIANASGKTKDDLIKDDLKTFFTTQITKLDGYALEIKAATSVDDLKSIIDKIQVYTDQQWLRDQAKSLAARVLSQRVLNFSKFIQDLVVYIDCLAPKLGDAGFDVSYYNKYMAPADSRFKTGWYQATEIIDPKRPWETFNFVLFDIARSTVKYTSRGGKWEYQKASDILADAMCKGSTKCKEDTTMHLRSAKYNVQDMFHVFYGFYDRIQKQVEAGLSMGGVDSSKTCKMPKLDGFSSDSSKPIPWPSGSNAGRGSGLKPTSGSGTPSVTRPTGTIVRPTSMPTLEPGSNFTPPSTGNIPSTVPSYAPVPTQTAAGSFWSIFGFPTRTPRTR